MPAIGLRVVSRKTNQDILANTKEDVEKLVEQTWDISQRLSQNVFSKVGEDNIGNIRKILDLPGTQTFLYSLLLLVSRRCPSSLAGWQWGSIKLSTKLNA